MVGILCHGGLQVAKIELELPTTVSAEEARLLLAIKLYETDRLSLGKAAELAGYSVRAFAEILAHYGVALYRYDPDELEREGV
jgi:predicted HTH domain antitoxin